MCWLWFDAWFFFHQLGLVKQGIKLEAGKHSYFNYIVYQSLISSFNNNGIILITFGNNFHVSSFIYFVRYCTVTGSLFELWFKNANISPKLCASNPLSRVSFIKIANCWSIVFFPRISIINSEYSIGNQILLIRWKMNTCLSIKNVDKRRCPWVAEY